MYSDVIMGVMNLLPLKVFAATCTTDFFGIPAWYKYLKLDPTTCEVIFKTGSNGTSPTAPEFFGTFLLIGLAVIDILLRIGGLVAVAFVIYGGIRYVTSQGEPDKTAQARGTVINALIGMAVCMVSIALVSFVGSRIGG
jgi:hypothetical protein